MLQLNNFFFLKVKLTHTVRAAPSTLGGLLQLRLETHKVIGSGAGVTQNDLTALLTHLTIVLMVRLVAVSVFSFTQGEGGGEREPRAQTSNQENKKKHKREKESWKRNNTDSKCNKGKVQLQRMECDL